jgi:hypothetical protein
MKFDKVIPILYSANVVASLAYYTEILEFENKWVKDLPTFGGVSKDCGEVFFCEKEQGSPGTAFIC